MGKIIKKYLFRSKGKLLGNIFFVFLQVVIQTIFLMAEMKNIIDKGVGMQDMDYILHSGLRMMIFTLLVGLCTVVASRLSAQLTAGITADIRQDCYRKVLSLSPQDYNRFGESALLTRTLADATQIQIFMINILRSAMTVPIIIVVMLILIARMNWMLFLILFCAFSFTVGMMIYFGAKSKRLFAKTQLKIERINLLMKEKITGARTIRAFNNEKLEEEKLGQANYEAYESTVTASRINNFLSPASLIVMNWAIVFIYLAGSRQLQEGMTSISDLLMVFQYLAYFVTCLGIVPILVSLLPKMAVSCSRINELLEYEKEVDENPGAKPIVMKGGGIEFEDVIFGYAKATNTIANVSFTISPGTTTAFIGTTGSGKTTIMNLLMGFYEPTFGTIRVDGQSLKEVDKEEYRRHLSYAAQKAYVFQDTAFNNIAMYDESVSEERVQAACEASRFDEVITKMPDGLKTMMAQDGRNISGGQRQRMSIARCVVKDADIYIFDDTFSALDAKTESVVLGRVQKLLKGKTVLMVAQKISTIRHADQIIVLDKGRIVGKGTHEELLQSCREYQDIYKTQNYLEGEGKENAK